MSEFVKNAGSNLLSALGAVALYFLLLPFRIVVGVVLTLAELCFGLLIMAVAVVIGLIIAMVVLKAMGGPENPAAGMVALLAFSGTVVGVARGFQSFGSVKRKTERGTAMKKGVKA